jgi:DNA-binding transcriptional LysR family regulator
LPETQGPFLYYPGRRQRAPSLTAFVDFLKEWRAEGGGSKKNARVHA